MAADGGERGRTASPPEEVVSNAAVMLFGGIETTEGMIANALAAPARAARTSSRSWRQTRGCCAGAIEESLRLEPAAAVIDRYATRDVDSAARRSAATS